MARLLLLQLLLALAVAVFGDPTMQKFVHPSNCDSGKPNSCIYIATWTMEKDGLSVTVDAKQPGSTWTGLGFTTDKTKKKIDMVYGGITSEKKHIFHGLSKNDRTPEPFNQPMLKSSLDRRGDHLILKFTHPIHPLDTNDFTFTDNDCYYFYFPIENKELKDDDGTIDLKSGGKGILSMQTICVKDLKNQGPKPIKSSTPKIKSSTPKIRTSTKMPVTEGHADLEEDEEEETVHQPSGEWRYPSTSYKVTWNLDSEREVVKFHVESKQSRKTWIGIGFAMEKPMIEADVVYGFKDSSDRDVILHGKLYADEDSPEPYDPLDLPNKKITYENGYLKLDFEHRLKPTTDEDACFLDNCYYFLFPVEGGEVRNNNNWGKPKGVVQYSEKKICIMSPGEKTMSTTMQTPAGLEPTDQDAEEEQMWSYPPDCDHNKIDSCDYVAGWELDENDDVINFRVESRLHKSKPYVGIGFAKEREPENFDFVYVLREGENDLSDVRHGRVDNSKRPPIDYRVNELSHRDAHLSDDKSSIIISFSHPRKPSDQKDFPFDTEECYHLVFPYEGVTLTDSDESVEQEDKYYITEKEICIKARESGVPPKSHDFIGVTDNPSQPSESSKRVCYFSNLSQNRPGDAKFLPSDIDPSLCTHIIYAFATLRDNRLATTAVNDESIDGRKGLYEQINDLKEQNRNLKTLLAVGGLEMNNKLMTKMLSTEENRDLFISTSIEYLRQNNFDGLDLVFLFPGRRGSPPQDKDRFTLLIQELRAAFQRDSSETGKTELLLAIDISIVKDTVDHGYNVEEISKDLDFINLMTYDLHSPWERVTAHHSSLLPQTPTDQLNLKWGAEYLVSLGAPKEKLVIGMPIYGRGFVLEDPNDNGLGAAAKEPSEARRCTQEPGLMAYYEICPLLIDGEAKRVWIEEQQVPYLVDNDIWIGYDDQQSLKAKVMWLKQQGYGGWMAWISDYDDFTGTICQQGKYPLIRTLSDTLLGRESPMKASLGKILSSISTTRGSRKVSSTTSGSRRVSSITLRSSSVSSTTPGLRKALSTTPGSRKASSTTPGSRTASSTTLRSSSVSSTTPGSRKVSSTTLRYGSVSSTTPGSSSVSSTTPGSSSVSSGSRKGALAILKSSSVSSTTSRSRSVSSTTESLSADSTEEMCLDQEDGRYPEKDDCTKYIECTDHDGIVETCEDSEYFDTEGSMCKTIGDLSDDRKQECELP